MATCIHHRLLSLSPYILVCFLLSYFFFFLCLKEEKKAARVIFFFLPSLTILHPLHGNVSSSYLLLVKHQLYIRRKSSRLLTYKPRAPYLWLVRPPPSSPLAFGDAGAISIGRETRDVDSLSGQLGSWLSPSSDGSQRSDCSCFLDIFKHFHFITTCCCCSRPRLDYFQLSTMCASVTLDPLG